MANEFVVKEDKVYFREEARFFKGKSKSTEVSSLQTGLFGENYAVLSDHRYVKIREFSDLCLIKNSLNLL